LFWKVKDLNPAQRFEHVKGYAGLAALLLPSQLGPGRYTIVPAAIVGFDALNGGFLLDVLLNTLR